ncbi:MAG TPA: fibronectin type III domain-containing protein [Polyangiaceae bacterium]|nr:fibronectin type III domain-containing protein [Polyangiaceae bacterium]
MPRLRRFGGLLGGSGLCATTLVLVACGSDGNSITCGKGTVEKGSTCVVKPAPAETDAGSGGTTDSGFGAGGTSSGGTSNGGSAGTGATASGGTAGEPADSGPADVIDFKGAAAAAPGASTPAGSKPPDADSVRLAWEPATYITHPLATLKYEIFASTSAGMENFEAPIAEAPPGSTSFLVQGLDTTKMYFVVRAVANEGIAKDENKVEVSATPSYDDKAPSAPSTVKAASATSTSVTLSWKAATDDKTPPAGLTYDIYWGTKTGSTTTLGAVSSPGATSATVTGLPTPKTQFFFRVVAVDAAGNASTNKDDIAGKTSSDVTAPVFGGCSAATDPTAGGATVVWTPAVDDTTPADKLSYAVYAFEVPVTRDTPFDKLDPTATFTGGTSGEITGLKNGTTYRVVCRAIDSSGNHDDNRVTQVFTTKQDGKPPTFAGVDTDPASFTVDSTQVTITWPPATDDQSDTTKLTYFVYASTTPGDEDFTAPPIGKSEVGLLSTQVVGLLSNTQYYFVVRAVDEAGNVDKNTAELGLSTLVSFADDVQPIFTANCALPTCHVPGNPPQGQILQAGFAYNSIVGQLAGENPNLKRIDPTNSDPLKSYLYLKITGGVGISGSSMPPSDAQNSRRPLNDNEKNTIRLWIVQGAKNN